MFPGLFTFLPRDFGFGSTLGGPMDTGTVRLGLDREWARITPEPLPSDSRQLLSSEALRVPSWCALYSERLFTCIARRAIFWEQFPDRIAMGDLWGHGFRRNEFWNSPRWIPCSLDLGRTCMVQWVCNCLGQFGVNICLRAFTWMTRRATPGLHMPFLYNGAGGGV